MSTPTDRERRILFESGRWDVVELLTETDDAIKRAKTRQRGDTGFEVDGQKFYRLDTANGIELRPGPGEDVTETVTWPTVRRIAAEVPGELRTRLAEHRVRSRQHQADYPLFAASKAAVGCGNPWAWVRPLTERQACYEAEYNAWLTGPLREWRAGRERLDAECEELLTAALLDLEPVQGALW